MSRVSKAAAAFLVATALGLAAGPALGKSKGVARTPKGPQPLDPTLPREVIQVPAPELKELICPVTKRPMQPGFVERIEVLARRAPVYFVKAYERTVFVSPAKTAPVYAAWPADILPRARVHASVVGHIAAAHYSDHQPFHRIEQQLARTGVELARSTQVSLMNQLDKLVAEAVAETAIDFETANSSPASACSVGLVRVRGGEVVAQTGWLIRPPAGHDEFNEWNTRIHGIQAHDVVSASSWVDQLDRLCAHHDALRAGFDEAPVDRAALIEALREIAPFVLQYAQPVWKRLNDVRKQGAKILFEGAQGVLLDVDHGTYPFVTSSNTVSGTAASGSGLGPASTGFVLGIVKAYTTRVGSGPFPTELSDEAGQRLGERGHEFGTVTGRQRRCGWFDAVLVRQSCAISGVTGIALTKLDVLDGFDKVKICTGYRLDGEVLDYFPAHAADQAGVEPVYEEMDGWSGTTAGARSWAQLPAQAIKYIRRIEELIETPVALVSTSPERADTILVRDPFLD